MNKNDMIDWAKKYIKDGNKLIQRNFKSNIKNSLPFSLTQINKKFGEWSNFYEIIIDQKYKIAQQSKQVCCKNCKKKFTKRYSQILKTKNNFCSRSCFATFNNHKRGPMKEETKRKITESYKYRNNKHVIFLDTKNCKECGKIFEYNMYNNRGIYREIKYCSNSCKGKVGWRIGGKAASAANVRRSKNEIYFADLCIELLGEKEVLTNEPMFDGWDADVIIPKYKLAILWNGIWHYQKVREKHSLEQVQSRDRIKAKIIEKYNYELYIIKDMGRYNKKFVEEQFNTFKNIYFPNLN
jgi:hypothetical protein